MPFALPSRVAATCQPGCQDASCCSQKEECQFAMKTRFLILLYFIFSAVPLCGRPKIDTIVMKNGDHWTCEIKRLEEGVLYAGVDYVDGTISVDWSKVARLESSQLFLVKTQAGFIYTGTLKTPETPADEPVKIEITEAPSQQVVLARKEIVEVGQTSETFWRRFSGSINGGLIFSKSNSNTQYNLSSQLKYVRARWSAQASYSTALSSSEGATTTTRNQLTISAERNLRWNNWYYAGLADFLQSSSQGIDLQTSVGAGIGRYLKNTNRARIALTGGLAWQGTNYVPSGGLPDNQNLIAALISTRVQAFKFKKTNLNLSASLLPALSQPGRVRFNTNIIYSIEIFNHFWWNFTFYGNWDNRPPATLSGSDYGSSSGTSYTFP